MVENGDGSGAPATDGGATVENKVENQESKTQSKETVLKSDHKRVLDDMHRYKRDWQEEKNKRTGLETKQLADDNNHKELYEREKTLREQGDSELESERKANRKDRAYNAVRAAAIKAGLRNEADLDLLDYSDVQVDKTESGRYEIRGVDDKVESLKRDRPHWFKSKDLPNFNAGGTGGGRRTDTKEPELTPSKVIQLEKQYKREGTPEKITELYKKYREQKQLGG